MERTREESLERLVDRRVQLMLRTDGRYRYAENAEEAAAAEDVVELEAEREVIVELLELGGLLGKYEAGPHVPTLEELRVRLGELEEELRPALAEVCDRCGRELAGGLPSPCPKCGTFEEQRREEEVADDVMPCGCSSGSCYCG